MACPTHSAIHAVEIVPGTPLFVPLRGGGGEHCTAYTAGQNTVTTTNQLSKSVVLKKTETESEILKGERKKEKDQETAKLSLSVKKTDPKHRAPAFGSPPPGFPKANVMIKLGFKAPVISMVSWLQGSHWTRKMTAYILDY